MILYHGSRIPDIKTLKPSFCDGANNLYFSVKRENVVVYLVNAVELCCKQYGFNFDGKFSAWGPYGFDCDGKFVLQEYYPNAIEETYSEQIGYIYSADVLDAEKCQNIPFAYVSHNPADVLQCEVVFDVYREILRLEKDGFIRIARFENMTENNKRWLVNEITREYNSAETTADYKFFLKHKFDFLQ